jgi:prophage regulatory protein
MNAQWPLELQRQTDRIVRERERRQITGVSRTTAYDLERRGLFPARVRVAGNRVGWRLSELLAWIAERQPAA